MTGLLAVLMAGALATAGPAAAIEDPTRPDSQVTHGPSCRPGGIVVEVVAGTASYTVRLATSRTPAGEDEVTLAPGASAVLQTGDVAPGETIDPRLEFAALDGSGTTYVDELEDYTLTRPTTEDCEAATSPPTVPAPPPPTATVQPGSPSPSQTSPKPSTTSRPSGTTTTTAGTPTTGTTTSRTTYGPTTGTPSRTSATVVPSVDGPARGDGQEVLAGGTVSLRGAGFLPGEKVNVLLHGTDTVLATATAGTDGQVHVDVLIPTGATAGPATLDLVGVDSAQSTGVRLQVAAAEHAVDLAPRGAVSLASLIAAATALVLTAAALVSVAGTRHAERRERSTASS
ncbi:hypothetical protein GCU60_00765 [Blastococcus saxobsidens]|uniref:IPT/TIG domain-containing protein n=1 Tax=Blastococcus saxobsidens TaxID=138336 RepID=A0A6L9VX16_9ACTN|nr:hypothetical protein [Blastococcus saxobsidens]NEK84307.1 hypothetical protein [Blastococcus saxobsidens]